MLLGGILADRLGLRAPFLLFLAVALVTLVLGLGLPDEGRFTEVAPLGAASRRSRDSAPRISPHTYLTDPFMAGLLVTTFAHSVIQAVLFTFFPLLGTARGYSLTEIGGVLSVVRVAASALQMPCGHLVNRIPPSLVLLVGAVTLCAGIGLLLGTAGSARPATTGPAIRPSAWEQWKIPKCGDVGSTRSPIWQWTLLRTIATMSARFSRFGACTRQGCGQGAQRRCDPD